MLRPTLGLILLAVSTCLSAQQPTEVLGTARKKALDFTASLPNFICSEAVRRFQGPSGSEAVQQTGLLLVQLSYFGGKENYELMSVDDHPTHDSYQSIGGAILSGEFGSLLHSIFDPSSSAAFHWERLDTVRGHKATVYSYKVERRNSQYNITYREGPSRVDTITVAYHGLVYFDLSNLSVIRATIDAEAIPQNFALKHSSILLDYDYAGIAHRSYLLPYYAETHLATAKTEFKNQMQFLDYRKFEAIASLVIDDKKPDPVQQQSASSSVYSAIDLGSMSGESWMFPPPPRPSVGKTATVLAEARQAASGYFESLPAFVCTDVFRVFSRSTGQDSWNPRGALTLRLTHTAPDREEYAPLASDAGADRRRQEFDTALRASAWNHAFQKIVDDVLDPRSAALFRWDHWVMLRGHMTNIYSFEVGANLQGLVYVDALTHLVLRVFEESGSEAVLLDFDFAGVKGGDPALLPLRAVFKSQSSRYESEFCRP